MREKAIYKYLQGKASEMEIEAIFSWIELSQKNKDEFMDLKKSWALNNPKPNFNSDWNLVKTQISFKTNHYDNWYKYAAAIIIFLAASVFWYTQNIEKSVIIDSTEIVLEIEDRGSYKIQSGEAKVVKDAYGKTVALQDNDELIYSNDQASHIGALHTIKIPYGKTYKITLSDGTLVHLNSGTTLSYPDKFESGSNRVVRLHGEAYFEVKKDAAHPFLVETSEVTIEVLGTKFNISSYAEEQLIETALVEGSVKISSIENPRSQTILTLQQAGKWDKISKTLEVQQVNSSDHMAWVNGELHIKNMSFKDLATKLERAYNVKFDITYPVLETQKFTGIFKLKTLSISELLEIIKIDTDFNYTINKTNIVIDPPTNI